MTGISLDQIHLLIPKNTVSVTQHTDISLFGLAKLQYFVAFCKQAYGPIFLSFLIRFYFNQQADKCIIFLGQVNNHKRKGVVISATEERKKTLLCFVMHTELF